MPPTPSPQTRVEQILPLELGSRELLRTLDTAGVAVAIIATDDTTFLAVNESIATLLGMPAEELVGLRLHSFRPAGPGRIRQMVRDNGGNPVRVDDIVAFSANGDALHLDVGISEYGIFEGRESLIIVVSDASVRVEAQLQAKRLIDAADQVTDLVSIHDLTLGVLSYCNASYTAATGRVAGDPDNPFTYPTPSEGSPSAVTGEAPAGFLSTGVWNGTFSVGIGPDASWYSGTIVGEFVEAKLRYVTSVVSDVTAEHRRADQLKHDAEHDEFTGLANRAGVVKRLNAAAKIERESGLLTAVCHLDLDRFQTINELLGHAAGDQVIDEIARRLSHAVRSSDIVGRINGHEFVVVFDGVSDAEHARSLAERLALDVFDDPIAVDEHPITTTASIGVAVSGPGFEGESLLRSADVALYRAKHLGHAQIEVFTAELQIEAVRRGLLIEDLRQALQEETLTAWYQPIVSLTTGRVVSVEALVRWPREDGSMTPPDEFITVAESVDLIRDIDQLVLGRALDDIGELIDSGHDLELHVNLSSKRLTDATLPRQVARMLSSRGFSPERLCLELTETALALDPELAQQLLSDLSDLGLRLAIDDFGTGYSSLATLHHFDLDVLKIDKSFVDLLTPDEADSNPIITTILQLANSLGLETVAEGIETEHQREVLSTTSCALGQGYLFHQPMPFDALRSLVVSEAAADHAQSSLRS